MKRELWILFAMLVVAFIPIFWGLNSVGLFEPEETRYAQMSREMLASGDWWTPRLLEMPLLEKPPLTIWTTASIFALFGESEFNARLISLLSAIVMVWITYLWGCRIHDRKLGLTACVIMASTPLFFGMAKILSTDTLFAALVLWACYVLDSLRLRPSWLQSLALGVSTALAVLTKGPIGLVLIGVFGVAVILVERAPRLLLRFMNPITVVSFLAISLPWFVKMSRQYPQFFDHYVLFQHFGRFFGGDQENKDFHPSPIHYFVPVLIGGFFPWIFFLPQAFRSGWKNVSSKFDVKSRRLLWAGSALMFLFFSVSSGKRVPYLIPFWPMMSLGFAMYWMDLQEQSAGTRKKMFWAWVPLSVVFAVGLIFKNRLLKNVDWTPLVGLFPWMLAIFLGGYIVTLILIRRMQLRAFLLAASLWMSGVFFIADLEIKRIESNVSMKEIATVAGEAAGADRVLIAFPRYYPGISYYSKRPVRILGSPGELDFGTDIEEYKPCPMFQGEEFDEILRQPDSFVMMGSLTLMLIYAIQWDPNLDKFEVIYANPKWMVYQN